MRSRSLVALAVLVTTIGCPAVPGPYGFLKSPEETGANPNGGWADIWFENRESRPIYGELLSATPDSLWIAASDGFSYVVPRAKVRGNVYRYKPSGDVGGWTTVGALTTIFANGFFLAFTMPAWIVTGIVASHHDVTAAGLPLTNDELRKFARFPQGIPAGMDAHFLRLNGPP